MIHRWFGVILLGLMAVLAALLATAASAQDYPSKPVRVIVPFAAGGAPDVVARILCQQLTTQTGQPFVVDNRGGADGIVGAQAVAEAPPDGYTLLVTSSSFVINPSFHKKLPFDVAKDFDPVTEISAIEALILGVNAKVAAQSAQDLIALAKRPDSHLSFGSPGVGNILHLAAELFQARTGIRMVHVPYKGAAQAITGLLGGEVQVMFLTPPASLQFIQEGRIRALGYTHRTRAAFLPDVPTMAEAGVAGLEMDGGWTGMFAPAKMPPAILTRLEQEVTKAVASPFVRERLMTIGLKPVGSRPSEFKAMVAVQVKDYGEVVRAAGIAPQ
jgi:tripartite-type tricarboxylate transporter receptor subunit TctC